MTQRIKSETKPDRFESDIKEEGIFGSSYVTATQGEFFAVMSQIYVGGRLTR